MNSDLPHRFDGSIIEAVMELLNAYGLRAKIGYLEPSLMQEPMLAAVIPFMGSGLHGSLMLMTARKVIAATQKHDWTEPNLRDWIGELGNQALGCIRRRLSSGGLEVSMGLPAVLGAVGLNLRGIDERFTRAHAFSTSIGTLVVCIDVVAYEEPRLHWSEPPEHVSGPEYELF